MGLLLFVDYVNSGKDITTAVSLFEALQACLSVNSLAFCIDIDKPKRRAIESVGKDGKFAGSQLARHIVYPQLNEDFDAYIELHRYGAVKEAGVSRLKKDFIESVVPFELRHPPQGQETLTCVKLRRDATAPKVVLSKKWLSQREKADLNGSTAAAGAGVVAGGEEEDDAAVVVMMREPVTIPKVGVFGKCDGCGEYVNVSYAGRHKCDKTVLSVSFSAVNQAKRHAIQQFVHEPRIVRDVHVCDEPQGAFVVNCVSAGFASRPPRDNSRFDPAVRKFLRELYDRGADGDDSYKVSADEALFLLHESGNPRFNADQLAKPTDKNIKSLFSRWTQDRKKLQVARNSVSSSQAAQLQQPVSQPNSTVPLSSFSVVPTGMVTTPTVPQPQPPSM